MVNFKNWNLSHISDVLLLAFVTVVMVVLFHMIVTPLLVTLFPAVFTGTLTMTDTLLFILLVTILGKK